MSTALVRPVLGLFLGLTAVAAALAGPPEAGFAQRLDARIPPDLAFIDAFGEPVTMGEATSGLPTILVLGYYECPNLCGLVFRGVADALAEVPFAAGEDYRVVVVSIDPAESPAEAATARQELAAAAGPSVERWQFLTGDTATIAALTETVGFRYEPDQERDQFAHAAGLVVLTPESRVARYLFGARFEPRDVRLALAEAGRNEIAGPAEQLLLLCYAYDPATGRYSFAIIEALRALGVVTVLGLAGGIAFMLRSERLARTDRG